MPTENNSKRARTEAFTVAVVGVVAPLALFAIGVGHVFWHEKVILDWEAVALLITGVVLLFLPLREIAAKLLKVKIGKFELELRKDTEALSETVAEAEAESAEEDFDDFDNEESGGEKATGDEGESEEPSEEEELSEGEGQKAATRLPRWSKHPRHYQVDFDEITALRYEVDQLQSVSPKAALIRLASALEQVVLRLATPLKPPQKLRVRSFSMALDLLYRAGKLTPALASALSQFWTLRNKVVHQSARVDELSALPAIDDGFRLLAILQNIRGIDKIE